MGKEKDKWTYHFDCQLQFYLESGLSEAKTIAILESSSHATSSKEP